MSRVLVIGGRGFYGARVVAELEAIGVDADAASRSAGVRIDLNDSSTFKVMEGYDLVVNASDSVGAPPESVMSWCLARRIPFFDMGADAPTVERLLQLDTGEGVAVIGVGVFPGLSTALACTAAGQRARRVELGVRLSPLSGAGRANCALMAQMLAAPGVRYEGGRRVETAAVSGAIAVDYEGTGSAPSVGVGLPDVALIHRQTGAPEVGCYMALIPGFLAFNFRLLAGLIRLSGPLKPLLLKLTEWQLVLLRAVLLRGVKTGVQLTAIADRGTEHERIRQLSFADGHRATAIGVAAAVSLFLERPSPPPPGVYTVAGLLNPEALLMRARELM
jgi:hypothetical protein